MSTTMDISPERMATCRKRRHLFIFAVVVEVLLVIMLGMGLVIGLSH